MPTLVLDSGGSGEFLTAAAKAVAAAIPGSEHRSFAAQWHHVPSEVLGPVLREFFAC